MVRSPRRELLTPRRFSARPILRCSESASPSGWRAPDDSRVSPVYAPCHRPATAPSSSSHHTPLHSITAEPVRHDAQSPSVHPNPPLVDHARQERAHTTGPSKEWLARREVTLVCARRELRPPSDFVKFAFLTYFMFKTKQGRVSGSLKRPYAIRFA